MTWEEEILTKIDNNQEFSEKELSDLLDWEIARQGSTRGRWTEHMKSLLEINDRLFVLLWDKGLTENQEHNFWRQPQEVIKAENVEIKQYEVIKYLSKLDQAVPLFIQEVPINDPASLCKCSNCTCGGKE